MESCGTGKKVYFTELTVPWQNAIEEACERKGMGGGGVGICPVEVGCGGFMARSVVSLLGELGGRTRP